MEKNKYIENFSKSLCRFSKYSFLSVLVLLSVSCGGGGGNSNNNTGTDPAALAVVLATPDANEIDVIRDAIIKISFNKSLLSTSVTDNNVVLTIGDITVTGTVTYDESVKTISFIPDMPLDPLSTYTVTISGNVTDLSGNSFGQLTSWNFTTQDRSWREAVLIEQSGGIIPTNSLFSMNKNGHAAVLWTASTMDGFNDIWVNYYHPVTGWGNEKVIDRIDAVVTRHRLDIGVSPTGEAFAFWDQEDATGGSNWVSHYTENGGWSLPERIDLYDPPLVQNELVRTGRPEVSFSPDGKALAVWLRSDGNITSLWSNSYIPGSGWGTPTLIENDDISTSRQLSRAQFDKNGKAIVAFVLDNVIWSNTYTFNGGWGTPVKIADIPSVRIPTFILENNNNGKMMLLWTPTDLSVPVELWSALYSEGAGWSAPELVVSDDIDFLSPRFGMDNQGNAIAIWIKQSISNDKAMSSRYTPGQGWDTPVSIELADTNMTPPHDAATPEIVVDTKGNAIATWTHYENGGAKVMYNRFVVGRGWGLSVFFEHNDFIAFDPKIQMDGKGNAMTVWIQGGFDTQNVWSRRFE